MQSLPLIISILMAAAVVPPLVRALRRQGLVHENYRHVTVPFPVGAAIPISALFALIPLSLLQEVAEVHVFRADTYPAVVYVLGVAPAAQGLRLGNFGLADRERATFNS